jgi:rhodanese-related sulfurtransferase
MDRGDTIVILDVRTQEEYDAGHIPGAILVPNETIVDKQPELLRDDFFGQKQCR